MSSKRIGAFSMETNVKKIGFKGKVIGIGTRVHKSYRLLVASLGDTLTPQ